MKKALLIGLRKISCGLLLSLGCLLLCSGVAYASPTVVINGSTLDATAINDNGWVMVPMRAIFEALGATVTWDAGSQSITADSGDQKYSLFLVIGDSNVSFYSADTNATTNVDVAEPPMIVDGRTYVPVRVVGQGLGCTVTWDADTQTVNVTSTPQGTTTLDPATAQMLSGVFSTLDPLQPAYIAGDGAIIIKVAGNATYYSSPGMWRATLQTLANDESREADLIGYDGSTLWTAYPGQQ